MALLSILHNLYIVYVISIFSASCSVLYIFCPVLDSYQWMEANSLYVLAYLANKTDFSYSFCSYKILHFGSLWTVISVEECCHAHFVQSVLLSKDMQVRWIGNSTWSVSVNVFVCQCALALWQTGTQSRCNLPLTQCVLGDDPATHNSEHV